MGKGIKYMYSSFRYLILGCLMLLSVSSFAHAAVVGEENVVPVKVFPNLEAKFGFSDQTPADGTGYLNKFTKGYLHMDDDGHLRGTYYLYCLVNGLNKSYSITLQATPMKATDGVNPIMIDGKSLVMGYSMEVGSVNTEVFPVYTEAGLGIPAEDRTFTLSFGSDTSRQSVFLSNTTVSQLNIWYRSLSVDVDVSADPGQLKDYEWIATVTAIFTSP